MNSSMRNLKKRIISLPTTIKECMQTGILTRQEVMSDNYLYAGLTDDRIRVITPQVFIASVGDIPKIRRTDITYYAYDMVLEQGRILCIFEAFTGYIILKPLNEKRFLTFGSGRQVPFGFSKFKGYKYNKPILIVEGLRDCIEMQQIYPYTLAMQTAGISRASKLLIQTLTTNLILGFDADEPGQKATKRLKYDKDFNICGILDYAPYKDGGTITELRNDEFRLECFRTVLETQLNVMGGKI